MTNNQTDHLLYFAFGSNMLSTRLCRRCPGARFRTAAVAHGRRVEFNKLSEDSSGKANLVAANRAAAHGVVYKLPAAELPALDAFEGPGYRRVDDLLVTCLDSHDELTAVTYVARKKVSGLQPFDWYLALVLAGMHEHAFDSEHVKMVRSAGFVVDPEPSRVTRLNAMQDLAAAGYDDYARLLSGTP